MNVITNEGLYFTKHVVLQFDKTATCRTNDTLTTEMSAKMVM